MAYHIYTFFFSDMQKVCKKHENIKQKYDAICDIPIILKDFKNCRLLRLKGLFEPELSCPNTKNEVFFEKEYKKQFCKLISFEKEK